MKKKVFKSEQIVCSQRILNQTPSVPENILLIITCGTQSDKQLYVNLDRLLRGGGKDILPPPPHEIIWGEGAGPSCSYANDTCQWLDNIAMHLYAKVDQIYHVVQD